MSKALVLEGGGFRGLFTAGILDYFIEKNIEFDSVIGVSMGALMGMNFMSKQKERSKRLAIDYLNDKSYISYSNLLLRGQLVNWKYLFQGKINEKDPFDVKTFNANESKFYVSVYNLQNGVVEFHDTINNKHHLKYIQASASLPIASRKVRIEKKIYLDGGIVESLPFEKAINDGNKKTILILTRTLEYQKKIQPVLWMFRLWYLRYPKIYKELKIRHSSYNKLVIKAKELEAKGELFIFRPAYELNIGRFEKDAVKLNNIYDYGYQYAKERYKELIEYLTN